MIIFSDTSETFCPHNVLCCRHQLVFFMSAAVFSSESCTLHLWLSQNRSCVCEVVRWPDKLDTVLFKVLLHFNSDHFFLCMSECCNSRLQVRENIILSVKGPAHHSQHKQEGRIFLRWGGKSLKGVLSWEGRSWFLERDIAAQLIKCWFLPF